MTYTVLSNDQVNSILEGLTVDELDEFRHVLASSLHEFSTGVPALEEAFQQPERISTLHPETMAKTLYMPSCAPCGMGCKVRKHPQDSRVTQISPTGVLNLFRPDGSPLGIVNATALTAFRTALASTCLLERRNHVKTLTVFGSGLQAYWHIRLALMIRGSTIKHVHVINHRWSDKATGILKRFASIPPEIKKREGWSDTKFGLLIPAFHEYRRLVKDQIRDADVIYCCTASQKDLFDGSILTSHEGRKKGRLIIAVGSYTPEMRELPDDLIQLAVKRDDKPHRHFHKHAVEGGVIVVDNIKGVLKEAGEIIAANIGPHQLVELGELVMLHRLAIEESDGFSSSQASFSSDMDKLDIHGRMSSMSTVYGSGSNVSDAPTSPTGSVDSEGRRSSSFSIQERTLVALWTKKRENQRTTSAVG
ncbi:Ornithine cyclodeaminase/mu-crystallin [Fusarium oxysporum f. sp. vasinfectum]|nr:Ornithine cyclodeaminase/mu-crystallin [Fusarium oxysporum f. sp. vasinfectum]